MTLLFAPFQFHSYIFSGSQVTTNHTSEWKSQMRTGRKIFHTNENTFYSFFLRKMLGTRYGPVGTRFPKTPSKNLLFTILTCKRKPLKLKYARVAVTVYFAVVVLRVAGFWLRSLSSGERSQDRVTRAALPAHPLRYFPAGREENDHSRQQLHRERLRHCDATSAPREALVAPGWSQPEAKATENRFRRSRRVFLGCSRLTRLRVILFSNGWAAGAIGSWFAVLGLRKDSSYILLWSFWTVSAFWTNAKVSNHTAPGLDVIRCCIVICIQREIRGFDRVLYNYEETLSSDLHLAVESYKQRTLSVLERSDSEVFRLSLIARSERCVCSFFKENVRYPVWTCRDPISDSRNPMTIFSDSENPNRVPKTPLKKPGL